MPEVHEPKKSKRFWDEASQREMMLNLDEGGWYGWLFYRHPDGQWVSLRKATEQELFRLGVPVPQKVPEAADDDDPSEWAMQRAAQAWCQEATSKQAMIPELAREFAKILDKECEEQEKLRVQLAGCLTAADGATTNPAKQGQYGWSPAYQRVLDLRRQFDAQTPTASLEEQLYMESMRNRDREREERRYRDRRERFALAVFRSLILQEAADRRTKELIVPSDWRQLAKEAVSAADALEEELNPTGPVLPDYEA